MNPIPVGGYWTMYRFHWRYSFTAGLVEALAGK
jgi:hypothetical protein